MRKSISILNSHTLTTDFDLKVDDKATVTAMTNIDNTIAKDLKIQWYRSLTGDFNNKMAVNGANSLEFTIPTDKTGTNYYFCEVSCEMMGEKERDYSIPLIRSR